jgi:hypothetical protein
MSSLVEKWANQVEKSISNAGSTDNITMAMIAICEPWYGLPTGLEEAELYCEFMENNPENWVNFITNNFGDEWGLVAQVVNQEGY